MATKKQPSSFFKRYGRGLLNAAVLMAAVVLIVLQSGRFRDGLEELSKAQPAFIVAALAVTISTFLFAAAAYRMLVLKQVRYTSLLGIELAAAFVNRLLPAGVGSLGLHGLFLYKRKHSVAEATAVVGSNNLLGIVGHFVLLGVILAIAPSETFNLRWQIPWAKLVGVLFLVIATLLIIDEFTGLHRILRRFLKHLIKGFRQYVKKPTKPFGALLFLMLLTVAYVSVLMFCSLSLGIHLPFSSLFLVYTSGVLVGTVAPTPGGLVGVEAGLFAGFVAYSVPSDAALAIVLLFRLLTYALPIIPGMLAFFVVRRRHLI